MFKRGEEKATVRQFTDALRMARRIGDKREETDVTELEWTWRQMRERALSELHEAERMVYVDYGTMRSYQRRIIERLERDRRDLERSFSQWQHGNF